MIITVTSSLHVQVSVKYFNFPKAFHKIKRRSFSHAYSVIQDTFLFQGWIVVTLQRITVVFEIRKIDFSVPTVDRKWNIILQTILHLFVPENHDMKHEANFLRAITFNRNSVLHNEISLRHTKSIYWNLTWQREDLFPFVIKKVLSNEGRFDVLQ